MIEKLTEEIKIMLNENLEDEVLYLIKDTIESDYYLKENIEDLIDIAKDLAEINDYKIYNEGYMNCLVKDVKGRPYITNPVVSEYLAKEETADIYIDEIQHFIDELSLEHPDFVTCGRSSGYWGLKDVEKHIKVSENAAINFAHLLIDTARDKFNKPIGIEEVERVWVDEGDYLFRHELAEDSENFKFEDSYLEEMKQIMTAIDNKEQEMNQPEFWGLE